jgi:flagellar motor protein MotB
MEDDQDQGGNFWPAFTDLMLSVILILLLVIGGAYFAAVNVREIQEKQKILGEGLRGSTTEVRTVGNSMEIWGRGAGGTLKFRLSVDPHDPMLQRISFSDSVLFDPDSFVLKASGKLALAEVGTAVKKRLPDLAEIQIHGHADTLRTARYVDNLELASLRANEVFRFLRVTVGIDPARNLISATSFGEYSPAERRRDANFDRTLLLSANTTEPKRAQNRRIELLLFYRRSAEKADPKSKR